jgi:ABC-2 type transport system ATP-binding protein
MRMLVGLIRPSAGSGTVLGQPLDHPERFLHRVGALIENPAFFPGVSARDNLTLLGRLAGLPSAAVDDALSVVGLTDRADDRVGGFSLGMKQRVGIAAALLRRPEVLLLDEPSNGLDPAGMREIRNLVTALARDGATVLISSHLLHELESTADHLVVMETGRVVYQGPLDAYLVGHDEVVARPLDPTVVDSAAAVALELGLEAHVDNGTVVLVGASPEDAAALNAALCGRGMPLSELFPRHRSLEERFLATTRPS